MPHGMAASYAVASRESHAKNASRCGHHFRPTRRAAEGIHREMMGGRALAAVHGC